MDNRSGSSEPRGLTTARLLGLGAGSLGLATTWALYNTFMPLLLSQFIASSGWRGVVMGVDNVLALVLMPIIGAWSDRLEGPLGKRLPFLLVGMPLTGLLFAVLPLADATLVVLLTVDIVFLLAITVFRAPLVALMPDHVPPERRSAANGIITLMGAAGGAIGLLLLAPLFDQATWVPFAASGAIVLVSMAFVLLASERRPHYVEEGAIQEEAPVLGGLLADLRELVARQRGGAGMLLLAVFACFFGYSALEAQYSTFATQTLGLTGGGAGAAIGAASLAFMAMAVPAGRLTKRFASATVMRLGAVLLAIAALVAGSVADPTSLPLILAVGGAGWALVLVPAYPLVVNQGGPSQIGFYTGMYYLFGSAASIAGPAVVGGLMDAFGNRALFIVLALSMLVGAALVSVAKRRRL